YSCSHSPPTSILSLSLHDALPISTDSLRVRLRIARTVDKINDNADGEPDQQAPPGIGRQATHKPQRRQRTERGHQPDCRRTERRSEERRVGKEWRHGRWRER